MAPSGRRYPGANNRQRLRKHFASREVGLRDSSQLSRANPATTARQQLILCASIGPPQNCHNVDCCRARGTEVADNFAWCFRVVLSRVDFTSSRFLVTHDVFRKPVSTFRDHALVDRCVVRFGSVQFRCGGKATCSRDRRTNERPGPVRHRFFQGGMFRGIFRRVRGPEQCANSRCFGRPARSL
jgi:hypothetical protein